MPKATCILKWKYRKYWSIHQHFFAPFQFHQNINHYLKDHKKKQKNREFHQKEMFMLPKEEMPKVDPPDAPKKGKGKNTNHKGRGSNTRKGLIGKSLQTSAGEHLCWTWNSERGCNEVPAGGKYSRDLHLCSEPGCEKSHSMQNLNWQTTADTPIFHMPTSTFRSKSLLVGQGTSALRFFCIEIYAGTGRLPAVVCAMGLKDNFGIDC